MGVASAHHRPHIQNCGVHVGTALRLFPHSSQRITVAFTAFRFSLTEGRRKIISDGDNSQCSVWHKLPENWLDLIHNCVAP